MTAREKVAGELAAAKSAAERSRAAGVSGAHYQAQIAQIGRLQGELDHLNEINEEARPVVEAMEKRQREREQAEEQARVQRQNREERLFNEQLQAHYEERLNHYRLSRPGTPREVFDKEIWPELRRQYVAGEEDVVDRERREKAAPVF
jgi:hypothetical protein